MHTSGSSAKKIEFVFTLIFSRFISFQTAATWVRLIFNQQHPLPPRCCGPVYIPMLVYWAIAPDSMPSEFFFLFFCWIFFSLVCRWSRVATTTDRTVIIRHTSRMRFSLLLLLRYGQCSAQAWAFYSLPFNWTKLLGVMILDLIHSQSSRFFFKHSPTTFLFVLCVCGSCCCIFFSCVWCVLAPVPHFWNM